LACADVNYKGVCKMKNKLFPMVLPMVVLAISIVAVGCSSLPAGVEDVPSMGQESLLRGDWTAGEKNIRFDGEGIFSILSGISPAGTFRYSYKDSTLTLGVTNGPLGGSTVKKGSATLSADGNQLELSSFESSYSVFNGQYTRQ
jgi:hypothetical protein